MESATGGSNLELGLEVRAGDVRSEAIGVQRVFKARRPAELIQEGV